jgi:hypothetical protein
VAEYLVEAYVPLQEHGGLGRIVGRARAAAAEMRRDGVSVRYLRPILLPEDEVCLHLFEAPSADAVREASRRADLTFERIVEARGSDSITDGSGKR